MWKNFLISVSIPAVAMKKNKRRHYVTFTLRFGPKENVRLTIRNSSFSMVQGQLESRITCLHCNDFSLKFEPFMYLSLPLKPATRENRRIRTLEDALIGRLATRLGFCTALRYWRTALYPIARSVARVTLTLLLSDILQLSRTLSN